MKKIAFCFLTRREILPDKYWIDFFEGVDRNKYNIYIHSDVDYNIENNFFKEFEIKNKVNKESSVTVNARLKLIENCLTDEKNKKLIFLSEDFIPLFDFNTIYDFLIKDDKSYFGYYENFENSSRGLNFYYKNVDWHIISMQHAKLILNYNNIQRFIDGQVASEHYISTILYGLDELKNVENINLTHEDWGKYNVFNSGIPIFDNSTFDYFKYKVERLQKCFNLYNNKQLKVDVNERIFEFVNENVMHMSSAGLFLRKVLNNNLYKK